MPIKIIMSYKIFILLLLVFGHFVLVVAPRITFFYFAYGSLLVTERMRLNCPSATKFDNAKLKGYNLDFGTYNECWKGSMATVVPTNGTIVWGVVWKIHASELPELEKYHRKKLAYVPINVTLQLESGDHIVTRTYVQTNTTHKTVPLENLPCKRRPSLSYLKTVIKGAEEANLPEKYTNMLKTIPVREKLKDVDGVF